MLLRPAGRLRRGDGGGWRSTCCAASRRWRSRRAPCVFPGGSVDGRDADEEVGLGGPGRGRVGPRSSTRRPSWPGRWSARRSGRPSRSPACCWPGQSADSVVADTTGEDWEADRHALLDRSLSLAELLAAARLVLRSRPAAAVGAVDHPGGRAAPVRRQVLRRRAARGPAHQGRRRRGGRGGLGRAGRGHRGRPARRDRSCWPPTAVTLAELAACGRRRRRADRPREVGPLIPEVLVREGAVWLTVPGDLGVPAVTERGMT